MTNFTSQNEALILEALRAKIASVPGARNVIADEPLLDSKQDVLKKFCVQTAGGKTEVQYIKIDYLGWRDDAEMGCEDNPVVFLKYKIHSFRQYREIRPDNSTSSADIKALDIALHNRFRETKGVTKNNARNLTAFSEHAPLVLIKDIILGVDELTGAFGHIADYSIEVEIS